MTSILLNGSNPPPKGSEPLVPENGKRNILITSALPYCNNVPHLGTLIGCVLSADVYARFSRLRGYNAIYICGTDEYGTATEQKARAEGLTPSELCQKYGEIHRQCYNWFNISFDHFGRTATPKQTEIAQDIFSRLYQQGLLIQKETEQLFCQICDRFLADRFVTGECPHCQYSEARGDQCDQCSKLLSPIELVNPHCRVHPGITPNFRSSTHLYLDLSRLQPEVEKLFAQKENNDVWTKNTCDVTRAWLKDGLKPRCITRDLEWGTPVPLEDFKDKVFYVWFDAPIGYLSITAEYTDQWRKWWQTPESKTDDSVTLYQFLGKDNIPFHTIIFPATLIGADDNYHLLDHCSTTEYINYEGGKFSKSLGTGVFCDQVQQTGIPSYVWRYYLLSNRPEKSDTVFSWSDFQVKNNNELLANIGNFCHRGISFVNRFFDGKIVSDNCSDHPDDQSLLADLNSLYQEYIDALESVRIKESLKLVLKFSARCNKYFQDSEVWNLIKEENTRARAAQICYWIIEGVASISLLLEPFIPSFCDQLRIQLNCPTWKLNDTLISLIKTGHQLGKSKPLIQKITNDQIAEWEKQFGGKNNCD